MPNPLRHDLILGRDRSIAATDTVFLHQMFDRQLGLSAGGEGCAKGLGREPILEA